MGLEQGMYIIYYVENCLGVGRCSIINMTLHSIGWQACTLYVAEMAPKERRGFMVAMVNNVGATGLVVSHVRF